MPMSCCDYSCTWYGLHRQYALLAHADAYLYLQLHTRGSRFLFALLGCSLELFSPSFRAIRYYSFTYNFIRVHKHRTRKLKQGTFYFLHERRAITELLLLTKFELRERKVVYDLYYEYFQLGLIDRGDTAW
jgi:hypothetical protein